MKDDDVGTSDEPGQTYSLVDYGLPGDPVDVLSEPSDSR